MNRALALLLAAILIVAAIATWLVHTGKLPG
jgi:hypothetical protein